VDFTLQVLAMVLGSGGILASIIALVLRRLENKHLAESNTVIGVVGPVPEELIGLPVFGNVAKARRMPVMACIVLMPTVAASHAAGADITVCPPGFERQGVVLNTDHATLRSLVNLDSTRKVCDIIGG